MMSAIAHHLTAVYVLLGCIVVPLVLIGAWRFAVKRQQRKAQEAMRRGNQLHQRWLEASKQPLPDGRESGRH